MLYEAYPVDSFGVHLQCRKHFIPIFNNGNRVNGTHDNYLGKECVLAQDEVCFSAGASAQVRVYLTGSGAPTETRRCQV